MKEISPKYNDVFCPYCGCEMVLQTDAVAWWYECPECCARSPMAAGNMSALDAAKDMFKPMQKPLTLDEACETSEQFVYFEHKGTPEIHAADVTYGEYIDGPGVSIEMMIGASKFIGMAIKDYGLTYRFWERNPTDEERAAAKWEAR